MDLAEVGGVDGGCQVGAIELPSFLDVAPAISDVINNIVAAYSWSTDVLVLQDRRGYYTGKAGTSLAGKMCCDRQELLFVADRIRNRTNEHSEHGEDNTDGDGDGSGGNFTAPHWSDAVQELSVLRCNARILVRQPIVTYIYNASAAPSTLQYLDQRKTTQSVTMNITRVSYGPNTASIHGKRNSGYLGKLLPGAIKSHIYSLSLRLCYTLFTRGGVDLMNVKITRMSEVPAEVLQQLQSHVSGTSGDDNDEATHSTSRSSSSGQSSGTRSNSDGNSSSSGGDDFGNAGQSTDNIRSGNEGAAPSSDTKDKRDPTAATATAPMFRGLHAASSTALDEDFAADFQAQRNAWGKRLGAAMAYLDDHILGNTGTVAQNSEDFIYRPASYSFTTSTTTGTAAAADALSGHGDDRSKAAPSNVHEVFGLLTEGIARTKVVRRRDMLEVSAPFTATSSKGLDSDGDASPTRAVSGLLVETSMTKSLFLLQYHTDGTVYASCVHSLHHLTTSTVTTVSAVRVAAKSPTAITEDQLVTWVSTEYTWRAQQRWSEVTARGSDGGALSVVELLRAMQMAADQRGAVYNEENNNSHMCQEDGRRFLGLAVEVAQFLTI
jgi:hypothetical protein